jgi:hypothetical protein
MAAVDQPGVRRELLHPVEAGDVVDLIEDRERQDLADAGHRPESVKGVGIMAFGFPHDGELEVRDERVVLVDQRHVHFNALATLKSGKWSTTPSRLPE